MFRCRSGVQVQGIIGFLVFFGVRLFKVFEVFGEWVLWELGAQGSGAWVLVTKVLVLRALKVSVVDVFEVWGGRMGLAGSGLRLVFNSCTEKKGPNKKGTKNGNRTQGAKPLMQNWRTKQVQKKHEGSKPLVPKEGTNHFCKIWGDMR